MKKEKDISSRETRLQRDVKSWQSWCAQGTTESAASFMKWLELVPKRLVGYTAATRWMAGHSPVDNGMPRAV